MVNGSGKDNPNFGKKWSEEKKLAASIKRKKMFADNPEYRNSVGKSNRGKKFDQDLIDRMHGHRPPSSYGRSSDQFTDEERKRIGERSSAKFTEEYNKKYRQTMEDRGYWTPSHLIDPFKKYYRNSNWIESMYDFYTEENLQDIKSNGFFNAFSNTKGMVRDHIISRKTGFILQIPEILMRHPCNLQLIPHSDNAKKGFLDKRLNEEENLFLLKDLINKIIKYNKQWKEQEACLLIIKELYG